VGRREQEDGHRAQEAAAQAQEGARGAGEGQQGDRQDGKLGQAGVGAHDSYRGH